MTPQLQQQIWETVAEFFADECDMQPQQITRQMNIIEDLDGDSLMLLSLLEIFRRRYNIGIELKTLGKHLMKHPAVTVEDVYTLSCLLVEKGDDILSAEW
jgi:acyl carrier protein